MKEEDTAYNAAVLSNLQKELISPLDIERLGKAPAWVRSLVFGLLKRIMNLRAMLATALEAQEGK